MPRGKKEGDVAVGADNLLTPIREYRHPFPQHHKFAFVILLELESNE